MRSQALYSVLVLGLIGRSSEDFQSSLHFGPVHITGERRVLRELGPINNNGLELLASRERLKLVNLRRMASVYELATSEISVLLWIGRFATSQRACMQWVTVVRNSAE